MYPDRELPRDQDKNVIPSEVVEKNEWVKEELASGRTAFIEKDLNGLVHFNADYRNVEEFRAGLDTDAGIRQQDRTFLCELFETVFNHHQFTGRSGAMYKYEGLGCIYWHMVSKLLLATAETIQHASADGADRQTLDQLMQQFDRIKEGLVMNFSIAENMILGTEWETPYRRGFMLNNKAIRSFAKNGLESYEIAASSIDHHTGSLSGGNLQKVILAREIGSNPSVLIANQPCRGLDVGVIEYVHNRLLELRSQGVGILLFSEDLDEILTLSDRIAVIFKGEILGIFDSAEADLEKIGLLMAGVKEGL